MKLKTMLYGETYSFNNIKEILAKANEKKSGDTLARVGAQSDLERVAAKVVLADLTVKDITENPVVDYEKDSVTRIILDDLDKEIYETVKGLSSEVIAAVCKLMSNLDLMYVSSRLEITAHCNTTIGKNGTFSSRLQPNHPTDSVKGVTSSLLEGLSYGIGDAVLGLNPAIDTLESTSNILNLFNDVKTRLEIPTQICVLSHITTQMKALENGVAMDLCFQSIAGSEISLNSFGVTTDMLKEANDMMKELSNAEGPNYMYFETGQGSELSSNGHNGADQQTMEARCYGLARHYKPFLVNTVVGFIGPEYIYDTKELIRAALEDNFCGLMHGLPMGCDICYTNHMKADQNDVDSLLVMLASSGCRYVMGVPQGDDIMLMYQSTGFHDIATVREMLGKRPIREFELWLEKYGIMENGKLTKRAGDPTLSL